MENEKRIEKKNMFNDRSRVIGTPTSTIRTLADAHWRDSYWNLETGRFHCTSMDFLYYRSKRKQVARKT